MKINFKEFLNEQVDEWDPFGEEISVDKNDTIINLIINVLNNFELEYVFESDLDGLEYYRPVDVMISGTKNNWTLHFDYDDRKDFIMALKEIAPDNLYFRMSLDREVRQFPMKNSKFKYLLQIFTTDENFEDQFENNVRNINEKYDFDENDPFGEESRFDSTDAYEKIIKVISDMGYKYRVMKQDELENSKINLYRSLCDVYIVERENRYSLCFGFYFKRNALLKEINAKFPILDCRLDRGSLDIILNVMK